ncbi:glycosyltransferase family 87 protein [Constantimarinum furrinae]|uniref:Alpha-1,6-mannosyltransferase n=1 Tax=Constantimarinum furrinae TaxID=2562285 RepID=A0A7G8PS19_9FLAO|nr:glycosyltransferase family 87 protein [Constantimarinum furrinae]QNJ97135.1 alpha-1,6-mannosyltransferase [Constantimarinum furrinae]
MLEYIKTHRIAFLLMLACVLFYLSFGYDLERSDHIKLFSIYAALFYLSWKIIQTNKGNFWLLAGFGIFCRFLFIGALPNLSQDYFRFLWDGRLILKGVSPYAMSPEMIMEHAPGLIAQAEQLFNGMGKLSTVHFSSYPPVNQSLFALSALFAGKSILGQVIVIRLILIAADIGILYFGRKILQHLKVDGHRIFWYFLNPFIIIELTGNLHFEGVMLFFFIGSMYLLLKSKWLWAAVLLGLSISVKLIPFLFLPLFFQWFIKKYQTKTGLMKLIGFYVVCVLTVALTFLPFISSELISNFGATLSLWFQNFEFNASIHYVIRWIAFKVVGWNIIETTGMILSAIVFAGVLAMAFFRRNHSAVNLFTAMVLSVSLYFLLSTTVHPWYIATPLLLCIVTRYRFPLLWSILIVLSYSAYGNDAFEENMLLIAIEYAVVLGYAGWEIFFKKPTLQIQPQHP